MEEKLAVNKGNVTRLGWCWHSAEGRTENKLQKEGKVDSVFIWLEQSSVLLQREARGNAGLGGLGYTNRHHRNCWPSIHPRACGAPIAEEGKWSPGLAWVVASVPSVSCSLEDRV